MLEDWGQGEGEENKIEICKYRLTWNVLCTQMKKWLSTYVISKHFSAYTKLSTCYKKNKNLYMEHFQKANNDTLHLNTLKGHTKLSRIRMIPYEITQKPYEVVRYHTKIRIFEHCQTKWYFTSKHCQKPYENFKHHNTTTMYQKTTVANR